MEQLVGIIGSFIGIVTFIILTHHILSARKGVLSITLEKSVYRDGDVIRGALEVCCKQPVQCHSLTVSLQRRIKVYRNGDYRLRADYDQKKTLETNRLIPSDARQIYLFEFTLRKDISAADVEIELSPALQQSMRFIGLYYRLHPQWRIYAYLDALGMDLEKGYELSIV